MIIVSGLLNCQNYDSLINCHKQNALALSTSYTYDNANKTNVNHVRMYYEINFVVL